MVASRMPGKGGKFIGEDLTGLNPGIFRCFCMLFRTECTTESLLNTISYKATKYSYYTIKVFVIDLYKYVLIIYEN